MNEKIEFVCPEHGCMIVPDRDNSAYLCEFGCRYPTEGNIPRFVADEHYASAFGAQWNEFRTTQLDSSTGLPISRDRLKRIFGGSLDGLQGKRVLEAGCGAGRFTEIMLEQGAEVYAVDISQAVEANYHNCSKYQNYFICQADIQKLPFKPGAFDAVVCVGVVQHTPDPEKTISKLCSCVRPGGMLVMDHYTFGYPATLSRRLLRALLVGKSTAFTIRFSIILTGLLWPLHRLMWRLRKVPLFPYVRAIFLRLSPVVDYHDAYLQLGDGLLRKWAALDMHDTVTDVYKHLRSAEQIKETLRKEGMTDIVAIYAGNGVEARAVRPLET